MNRTSWVGDLIRTSGTTEWWGGVLHNVEGRRVCSLTSVTQHGPLYWWEGDLEERHGRRYIAERHLGTCGGNMWGRDMWGVYSWSFTNTMTIIILTSFGSCLLFWALNLSSVTVLWVHLTPFLWFPLEGTLNLWKFSGSALGWACWTRHLPRKAWVISGVLLGISFPLFSLYTH